MHRAKAQPQICLAAVTEHPPQEAPLTLDGLFRRFGSYVGAIALRILGRDDEVDDVVQEVFLCAMGALSRFYSIEAARGWLATVTVRTARRRLRLRRMRSFLGLDRVPSYEAIVAPDASPEQRALLCRLYELLDALPVDERIAWTLRHIEGERLEEVARLCGCSLATAKRRITAAHDRLERRIADG
jgi:RNA polymerase sigma-70 factor, ECF subfamily